MVWLKTRKSVSVYLIHIKAFNEIEKSDGFFYFFSGMGALLENQQKSNDLCQSTCVLVDSYRVLLFNFSLCTHIAK